MKLYIISFFLTLFFLLPAAEARRVEILFLGDNGHHKPAERYPQLLKAFGPRGINLTYTDKMEDINPENLALYDGLMIFANWEKIEPAQENAMLEYVRGGKGLIPLHCASYCFRNSMQYVAMVGGQFKSHGTGTFRTTIVAQDDPIMKGFPEFETWDETYVHTSHNPDKKVLQKREDEPYTWTRSEGKGRVFYTAYGHDERTFGNPGFHELVARGTLWAIGDDARKEFEAYQAKPLVYSGNPEVPNYERRNPPPQFQHGLSAEESMKHIQVPADCELSLFAAEPDIFNVIEMQFDERGRLWVVETKDYPNELKPPAEGRDRIRICEDTNGDGKMDKATLFADQLSIPTSMCFANGGVVVTAAPYMYFFKDNDGDGKADERKELFKGWGDGDTHAGPSNMRYGFDNWIWGTVGYSGFNGEIGGEAHKFSQAVWRMKPDGSKLEVMGYTTNNTWGLGETENNDIMGSTANNMSSFYLPIPLTAYHNIDGLDAGKLPGADMSKTAWVNMDKLRQVDVFGGFTAAAGHEVYTARYFPQVYWNRAVFVCEPTCHLIYRGLIKQEGATLKVENGWNLLAGAEEWVAPVQSLIGPDGAVWVSDFYSFLIQHNPTPSPDRGGFKAQTGKGNAFVSELRDTEKARIYRIAPKKGEPSQQWKLTREDVPALLVALQSDNLFWRKHAQRLLVERGKKDVVASLLPLITRNKLDAVGVDGAAVHAIWTLAGLGVLDGSDPAALSTVVAALKHPAQGARRAALQALPANAATAQALAEAGVLTDAEPLVRLAALNRLCQLPANDTLGEQLYDLGTDPVVANDAWLSKARLLAAARQAPGFIKKHLLAAPAQAPKETPKSEPSANLLLNPSFETADKDMPANWKVRTYSGQAEHKLANIGKTGGHSVMIESKAGADTSFHFDLDLEPGHDYLWTGWIKTEGLASKGGKGAMLEVHALNGEQPFTKPLNGTTDWTKVELRFSTKEQRAVSLNCLYGGWGHSTGRAYWDDLSLTKIGPTKGGAGGGNAVANEAEFVIGNFARVGSGPDRTLLHAWLSAEKHPAAKQFADILNKAPVATEDPSNSAAKLQQEIEALKKTHQMLELTTIPGKMAYDKAEVKVKAGQPVAIVFKNPDTMQHNIVIGHPDSRMAIGKAADALMLDPKGAEKGYQLEIPEVIVSSKMLDPNQTAIIKFEAPKKPGDYVIICTFPTHWITMHAVLKVE